MADETQNQQPQEASMQIITQYVKDLSFENPNSPESLLSGWPAPETQVQISLMQNQLNDDVYEAGINVRVEAKNKKDDKMVFIVELQYAAAVALQNIPKENIPAVLMVEVPKLLFPFVREIVAKTTANGGYPPLYLAPVSFEQLYISEVKRLKAEQGKAANN